MSKLDANTDLYSILAKARHRYVARAVLREQLGCFECKEDKRIRVEKLYLWRMCYLYWLVKTGSVRIAIKDNEQRISAYLSSSNTYSFILRYLLFKKRDKESMLDWLIEAKLPGVALAAATALDSSQVWSEEIAPLRALFISLLYPRLTLWDMIELLQTEGYSGACLEKSITLLNLAMK